MSAKPLLREFERIEDAPNAVVRLRRLVLGLAVRGKLVSRSESEGTSTQLLSQIRSSSPERILLEPSHDGPYPIPAWWDWVPLGDTLEGHVGGGTPSKNVPAYWDGEIHWASVKDVGREKYLTETIDRITDEGLANSSSNLVPAGRLIVVTRMGLGKVSISRIAVAINQDLRALSPSPHIDIEYQYIFLKTHGFEGSGLTVKGIRLKELLSTPFPLPPLEEQHRIVAKVDELMALCDQLEATQKKRELQRDALRSVSLHRLTEPLDEPADVRFFLDKSPRLITKPEHLAAVRQTILDLAVRGRLVPQDSGDERITGSDTSNGRVPAIAADERPFELPESWEWRRLGLVAALINGDRSKNYPNKNEYLSNGVAWINTGHIDPDGTLSKTRMYYISRAKFDSLRAGKIRSGDLVYCLRGATFGKTAIVDGFEEGAVASSLVIIRVDQVVAIPTYVRLYLISPTGQQLIRRFDNGSAQPNLAASSVKLFVTPLPPLAEQHRIVAKVDELMAVCDELEAALDCAQHERARLLESLLSDALNVAPDRPGDIQD